MFEWERIQYVVNRITFFWYAKEQNKHQKQQEPGNRIKSNQPAHKNIYCFRWLGIACNHTVSDLLLNLLLHMNKKKNRFSHSHNFAHDLFSSSVWYLCVADLCAFDIKHQNWSIYYYRVFWSFAWNRSLTHGNSINCKRFTKIRIDLISNIPTANYIVEWRLKIAYTFLCYAKWGWFAHCHPENQTHTHTNNSWTNKKIHQIVVPNKVHQFIESRSGCRFQANSKAIFLLLLACFCCCCWVRFCQKLPWKTHIKRELGYTLVVCYVVIRFN